MAEELRFHAAVDASVLGSVRISFSTRLWPRYTLSRCSPFGLVRKGTTAMVRDRIDHGVHAC
jgi:hypothetical protein